MKMNVLALFGLLVGLSWHMNCLCDDIQHEQIIEIGYQSEVSQAGSEEEEGSQKKIEAQNSSETLSEAADSYDLSGIDIDQLFTDLQEFEKQNPVQDIPLADKINLAWEYIKIKALERKGYIIGASICTVAGVAIAYAFYKKLSQNRTLNPNRP